MLGVPAESSSAAEACNTSRSRIPEAKPAASAETGTETGTGTAAEGAPVGREGRRGQDRDLRTEDGSSANSDNKRTCPCSARA